MSKARARLRLFFALLPPERVQNELLAAARSLPLAAGARLVSRNNLHMTLAFVGDVPASQRSVLQQLGRAVRAPPISVRLDVFEYWPKPAAVVATADAIPDDLQSLWQDLHRDPAAHEWVLDAQHLRPHVTLVRGVSQAPALQVMKRIDWVAHEFCLMRSERGNLQSVYTVVDTWPLLYEKKT